MLTCVLSLRVSTTPFQTLDTAIFSICIQIVVSVLRQDVTGLRAPALQKSMAHR
jgi:hypothetical protein